MSWRRWLVGFGLSTLAASLAVFFLTDWPFFGRTGPGEYPCIPYESGVPRDHFLMYLSEDTERFPPGVRCRWRECVLQPDRITSECKQPVGTRSRFVEAKGEAYLILFVGSAGTALVLSIFALLWLAVFLGPRTLVRILKDGRPRAPE